MRKIMVRSRVFMSVCSLLFLPFLSFSTPAFAALNGDVEQENLSGMSNSLNSGGVDSTTELAQTSDFNLIIYGIVILLMLALMTILIVKLRRIEQANASPY